MNDDELSNKDLDVIQSMTLEEWRAFSEDNAPVKSSCSSANHMFNPPLAKEEDVTIPQAIEISLDMLRDWFDKLRDSYRLEYYDGEGSRIEITDSYISFIGRWRNISVTVNSDGRINKASLMRALTFVTEGVMPDQKKELQSKTVAYVIDKIHHSHRNE